MQFDESEKRMNKNNRKRLLAMLFALCFAMEVSVTALAADTDKLKLKTSGRSENTAFCVEEMLPGDTQTKEFLIRVAHKEPISVFCSASIPPGDEKLAEVMRITVSLPDKGIVLYNGLLQNMPGAVEYRLAAEEKELRYHIAAYLDTGVGNEYQNRSLTVDFQWRYEAEATDIPKTGDNHSIEWYLLLFTGSLLALFLLLLTGKRRKGEGV